MKCRLATGRFDTFSNRSKKLRASLCSFYVIARAAATNPDDSARFVANKSGGARLAAIDSEEVRHSDRIRNTAEIEVARLQCGSNDPAAFGSARAHAAAELRYVLQQTHRTFIEAEVDDGLRHFAILDQEKSVAGETGDLKCLRIYGADVPESCDEQTPPGCFDEVRGGGVRSLENKRVELGGSRVTGLGCIVTIIGGVTDDALIDPGEGSVGKAAG
ncbi:MAG: hypothetical protein WKF37_21775 [Bryobacteraceae bacterium]